MRIIIFDLDGVLIDSRNNFVFHLVAAAKRFGIFNLSQEVLSLQMVRPMGEQLLYILGDTHTPGREADLLACFRRLCLTNPLQDISVFPGVFSTLQQLKEAGFVLALCTNKPLDLTQIILSELGLAQFFSFVYGGDAGLPRKPEPHMLNTVLAVSGCDPTSALFVGDSVSDVEAAKRALISSAAVGWGYTQKADLMGAKPDVFFDHYSEISLYCMARKS